jgi:excisionase family DNA binding protein
MKPRSTPVEPLVTYEEAARFLRVSRATLCKMVNARRIPHLRVGQQVRFDIEDLKRFFYVARTEAAEDAEQGDPCRWRPEQPNRR